MKPGLLQNLDNETRAFTKPEWWNQGFYKTWIMKPGLLQNLDDETRANLGSYETWMGKPGLLQILQWNQGFYQTLIFLQKQ